MKAPNGHDLLAAGIANAETQASVLRCLAGQSLAANVIRAVIDWRLDRNPTELADCQRRVEPIRERYLASSKRLMGITRGPKAADGTRPWVPGPSRTLRKLAFVSKSREWCALLFGLVRAARSRDVLEMGTCVGISASYLTSAARSHGGRVTTIEGSADHFAQARLTLEDAGVVADVDMRLGPFEQSLAPALQSGTRYDLVFVDGHHQGPPTLAYVDQIFPHLADEAVLIFDDIRWSEGMLMAWRQIVGDPRFAVSIDLYKVGICVRDDKAERLHIAFAAPRRPLGEILRDRFPPNHPLRRIFRAGRRWLRRA